MAIRRVKESEGVVCVPDGDVRAEDHDLAPVFYLAWPAMLR